uniref:Uncharacterized protein n=1 Tax=Aegilops tauschii subsp. strangulata TaxID=200361 RepID=A0A453EW90_AEGTS
LHPLSFLICFFSNLFLCSSLLHNFRVKRRKLFQHINTPPLASVSSDLYDYPTRRSPCATPLFSASVCAICVSAGLPVAGLGGAKDNT